MNTILPSVITLLRNSKRSLMYVSIAAITMGVQELFESVVFSCPCEGHFAYGMTFLYIPALILFLPGILLDGTIWTPRRKRKPQTHLRRCFEVFFITMEVFLRAAIAPTAWLVLSFLQQKYYTCAFFGPPLKGESSMNNTTQKCYLNLGWRSRELEEIYKTRSQIAGWTLMLTALLILFLSISIRRYILGPKHLRLPNIDYYHHVEAKEALEKFHVRAKEIAKEKANREICKLFANVRDQPDAVSCLPDVANEIERKYRQFFAILPESPSFLSPDSSNRDGRPDFHTSTGIYTALGELKDEFLGNDSETCSTPTDAFTSYRKEENGRQLARVKLRQNSADDSSQVKHKSAISI